MGAVLTGPIAGGEVLGAAVLPLLAAVAAVPLGSAAVVAMAGAGVLAVVLVAPSLSPAPAHR